MERILNWIMFNAMEWLLDTYWNRETPVGRMMAILALPLWLAVVVVLSVTTLFIVPTLLIANYINKSPEQRRKENAEFYKYL